VRTQPRAPGPAPGPDRPISAAGRRRQAPQTRCKTAGSDPRPPPTTDAVLDGVGRLR